MMSIISVLKEKQRKNLSDAILSLHCYAIYSLIDSGLATDGEIDSIILKLENILREDYE